MSDTSYEQSQVQRLQERISKLEAENKMFRGWVESATHVCEAVSYGDYNHRINGKAPTPEMQVLKLRINRVLDVTDAFVRESAAALTYAASGRYFRRVILKGMSGDFRDAAILINKAMDTMQSTAQALDDAKTSRLTLADDFELAIQGVVRSVATSSTDIRTTAQSLAEIAKETTEQSLIVASASEESSVSISSVASVTRDFKATVATITNLVAKSNKDAEEANTCSVESVAIVEKLTSLSTGISGVVKLISSVANQTNLLALNATIEAVRAGDKGKGFAVVASEVKQLAKQTTKATGDIENQINIMQRQATEACAAIKDVGLRITRLTESSRTIASSVEDQRRATSEISDSISELATAAGEISCNIVGVSRSATETSSSAHQMFESANELSRMSDQMTKSVEHFLIHIRQ